MAKTTPPDSHAAKADRVLWWWASLVAVLLVACGGLTIGLIAQHSAGSATREALKTAKCVNSILGVRAPLALADHANERRKIEDQIVAEKDKAAGLTKLADAKTKADGLAGFRQYQAGVTEFIAALNDWKARDDLIAAAKSRAPLGRC